jgi:hypothetical protein
MFKVLERIYKNLPNKDSKYIMELLLLLENGIGSGPKLDFIQILNDLLKTCDSYDQPYQHRVRTRVSKLHRKLLAFRDKEEETQKKPKVPKEEETSPNNVRSPLITQSNFLHRYALLDFLF